MNNLNQQQLVSLVSKSARRRVNRKLRQRVMIQQPSRQVLVVAPGNNNNGKTARNRRKRQKKNLRRKMGNGMIMNGERVVTEPSTDPITERFTSAIAEPTIKQSVHQCLQNHFFPDSGLHRGISNGSGNSALSIFRGSLTLNGFTTTNNVLSFQIQPAAAQTGAIGSLLYGTSVQDPGGAGNVSIQGVFTSTNPSTDYRVLHCSLRLIPSGAYTNQAGEGYIGYLPDYGAITGAPFTRTNVDQILWGTPISGVTNACLHWVPNDYETMFRGSGYAKNSALVGYLAVPSASATGTQFRLDYQIGVEYYPNATFRPYVELCPAEMHPDSYYHFNKAVRDLHNPLVAGTWDDFSYYLKTFIPLGSTVDNPMPSVMGNFSRSNIDRNISPVYEPGWLGTGLKSLLGLGGAGGTLAALAGLGDSVNRRNRAAGLAGNMGLGMPVL